MSKKIILGASGKTVYVLSNEEDGTVSYESYTDVFDYDEGEQKAKDYLMEDTYLWKDAVQNDRTTDSLEDWTQDVINGDGWRTTLGEDSIIDIDNMDELFCDDNDFEEGAGVPVYYSDLDDTEVSQEDFEQLEKALKDENEQGVNEFFNKYPEFDVSDMKGYI